MSDTITKTVDLGNGWSVDLTRIGSMTFRSNIGHELHLPVASVQRLKAILNAVPELT